MKAARLHRYDESIPPDSLKVEEIEEPKIEGPLDVIVRIGAAGLCRIDIHIVEGLGPRSRIRTARCCPAYSATRMPAGSRR